jgi:Putative amidoligase enzyme
MPITLNADATYSDFALVESADTLLPYTSSNNAERLLDHMRYRFLGAADNRLLNALLGAGKITQDEFNRVLNAPQATDTANCAHCGNTIPVNGEIYLREDERRMCNTCAHSSRYRWSLVQQRFIRTYDVIALADTGNYVSANWANANTYYSALRDEWYEAAEERDNAEDAIREERARESQRGIYDYHATNPIEIHGWNDKTPKNSLCFGVELEMEHKDEEYEEGAEDLSEQLGGRDGNNGIGDSAKGKYILMRDGSLNDSGVELITVPYTLEQHQKEFGWKEILGKVISIGRSGRFTSACGMHVHVNRAALSAFTLGKMLVFVNSPHNTALIEKIAQRNPEEWARRYSKKVRDGLVTETDKYEAMHLSRRTVEFRIFRGNLRFDRVLKNIEFCHAVTMFAKETSMQDLEKPTLFVAWLAKRKGTYPNLAKFLSETAFNTRLAAAANSGVDARPSTRVRQSEEI